MLCLNAAYASFIYVCDDSLPPLPFVLLLEVGGSQSGLFPDQVHLGPVYQGSFEKPHSITLLSLSLSLPPNCSSFQLWLGFGLVWAWLMHLTT